MTMLFPVRTLTALLLTVSIASASAAPLSPADGPETVPPVATPNPAQQHRLGQAGVIDMADRPDTGAMAPSAVDVDALQGLTQYRLSLIVIESQELGPLSLIVCTPQKGGGGCEH